MDEQTLNRLTAPTPFQFDALRNLCDVEECDGHYYQDDEQDDEQEESGR